MKKGMFSYQKIEDYFIGQIKSQKLVTGAPLPKESELCEQFGVSRMTVNKALTHLASLGYIKRVPGQGSYVKNYRVGKDSGKMISFTEQYKAAGFEVSTKLISYSLKRAGDIELKEVKEKLGIKDEDFVHCCVRLRYCDGEPMAIHYNFISTKVVPYLDINCLESSLYDYLEKTLHLSLCSGDSTLIVTDSDEEVRNYLDLKQRDPVVQINHTTFTENDCPFEYVITYCVYSKFYLHYTSHRAY